MNFVLSKKLIYKVASIIKNLIISIFSINSIYLIYFTIILFLCILLFFIYCNFVFLTFRWELNYRGITDLMFHDDFVSFGFYKNYNTLRHLVLSS